jgi:peptide/nickel transport system permease protein
MALNAVNLADAEAGASSSRGSRFAWLRGLRSPLTLVGAIITLIFIILALIGPLIAPYDPSQVSNSATAAPSLAHWLGTTQNGQDILSQMLYGAQVSVLVGFGAAIIATVLSVLVGLTAGYLGGIADELLSLLANVFLVLPSLPLTVILAAYLPKTGSLGIILVISITSWAWGARILRAQTLSLRRRDFVEAARATGERTSRIIFRDIFPNQIAIIAASFLSTVTGAILTQASLAFLGLTDVTQWSWGTILYWAQVSSALLTGAWWWFVPAGLAIALLGTGLSLVNFGIDEFINPRLRQAGIGTKKGQRALLKRPARAAFPRTRGIPVQRPQSARFTRDSTDLILDVRHLNVDYVNENSSTPAVSDVSFSLRRGEVLGIAGESGSGKSTLAYAITRLHKPPAQISSGEMIYTRADGSTVDILSLNERELRDFRWEELSIVFQSAMHALNPILRVGEQIEDAIKAHRPGMSSQERAARVIELLALVGIQSDRIGAYPHELSGGMRQRAMIAVGLALDPEIIVMDSTSSSSDRSSRRSWSSRTSSGSRSSSSRTTSRCSLSSPTRSPSCTAARSSRCPRRRTSTATRSIHTARGCSPRSRRSTGRSGNSRASRVLRRTCESFRRDARSTRAARSPSTSARPSSRGCTRSSHRAEARPRRPACSTKARTSTTSA